MAIADPIAPAEIPEPPEVDLPNPDDLIIASLVFVNEVRENLGLDPLSELLPGEVKNPFACPISQSIAYQSPEPIRVGTSSHVEVHKFLGLRVGWIAPQVFRLPTLALKFVSRFDQGEFPQFCDEEVY